MNGGLLKLTLTLANIEKGIKGQSMEDKILPKAIYVRVSTKEQAIVIQNGLSFPRFFMAALLFINPPKAYFQKRCP